MGAESFGEVGGVNVEVIRMATNAQLLYHLFSRCTFSGFPDYITFVKCNIITKNVERHERNKNGRGVTERHLPKKDDSIIWPMGECS